jgi:MFS family permease
MSATAIPSAAGSGRRVNPWLILFSAASLLNGLAQSSGMLIAGRGLQGLGGALVSPAALAIITTTFTDGGERTKALGVWSAIAASGAAVGLGARPTASATRVGAIDRGAGARDDPRAAARRRYRLSRSSSSSIPTL